MPSVTMAGARNTEEEAFFRSQTLLRLPSFGTKRGEMQSRHFSIDPSLLFTAPAGGSPRRQTTTGRDEKETGCRDRRRHFRPCLLRPLFSLFLHLSQARRSSTVPGLPPPLSIPRKSLLMIVFLPPLVAFFPPSLPFPFTAYSSRW